MRVMFYAPLKPPTHPVPSGDRRMARLLMRAIEAAGHRVELASRFRSRDGNGDEERQRRMAALGERVADRVIRQLKALPPEKLPDVWFTYHLYYKAPDYIGPAVCKEFGIPYVVAEASHAAKQADGPWAFGHAEAEKGIRAADRILLLNSADLEGLEEIVSDPSSIVRQTPFIDTAPFAQAALAYEEHRKRIAGELGLDPAKPWLTCVAMMRHGDKLLSYRALAEALGKLVDLDWSLIVIGDGATRPVIEAAFNEATPGRAVFLGRREGAEMSHLLAASDLYVWPAVNEAFGMAFLEAQAAGLPVVAGDYGGVGDVVSDGGIITPADDIDAFAAAIRNLLTDVTLREALVAAAQRSVTDIALASRNIDRVLKDAVGADGEGAAA
jgi:glycosyltransferase involved in cell wall biosynthesis